MAVVLLVGLATRAAVAGGSGLLVTFAALRDSGAGFFVLTGSLLVVLWALNGRAAQAHDGSALLLVGGGLLTVAGPWASWLHHDELTALLSPGARLAVGLPALLLLIRSVHLVPVDSSVRAFRSLTNAMGAALVLLGCEALLRISGPLDRRLSWVIAFVVLGVGWLFAGMQRILHPDGAGLLSCEQFMGLSMAAWGIGDLALAVALGGDLRWGVVGAAVQLVGAALAAWAAASMLLAELSRDGTRKLRLMGELDDVSTVLADEQAVRGLLLHDARNVVTAIRAANHTLERHGDRLEPAAQAQLREAVGTEFSKLQSLLDPAADAKPRSRS